MNYKTLKSDYERSLRKGKININNISNENSAKNRLGYNCAEGFKK